MGKGFRADDTAGNTGARTGCGEPPDGTECYGGDQRANPYLGALHEVAYGRPSLACDLVEEYRPFLGDRLVLGLINRKMVTPADFVIREDAPETFADEAEMRAKRPVEMKPAAVRAFISAYETMMRQQVFYPRLEKSVTYRWLILNQVRHFGQCLEKGDGGYAPFLWKI
ncbi:CRISPR-associated endonuclease Cas1 [Desulfonema ishimotonii]|uniref:CRISPR-associated endonuclease Cas1 n=1 Tax=Desulfonema ishimotonii TaxID=45657 RepID=A0A401G1Q1_9BACT|nr:CRISPR-associated endonuclease Cas1 [Desulfonema ishimotonii]GBC63136.1 CRISPR-associated endonuclease Cas1 [Desulfonema ishimotonii]